jgi:2-dehydro-3-deoxygluconokinase
VTNYFLMKKVFCFGELLLRYSPRLNGQWIHDAAMAVYVGGAELNAATALACWQIPVSYGTALPDHYLSKEICAELNRKNIETNKVVWSGSRIGTYYLPQGADLKNAGVIYDRAYSSFAALQPGQIDWDRALEDVSWFHFSAISPALNENIALVCKEALEAAAKKEITISVDLNYRAKLWQWGKEPVEVMPGLVQHCNVIMGNVWAVEKMLGIAVDPQLKREKEDFIRQSEKTSRAVLQQFPNCLQVANTFRLEQEDQLNYYATLFAGDQLYVSREHQTSAVIDKVGSGDTFMAGLIYGDFKKLPPQEVIDFAAAAAFDKLFIKGDATTSTIEKIKTAYLHYV